LFYEKTAHGTNSSTRERRPTLRAMKQLELSEEEHEALTSFLRHSIAADP
jgi:hypothetical protein